MQQDCSMFRVVINHANLSLICFQRDQVPSSGVPSLFTGTANCAEREAGLPADLEPPAGGRHADLASSHPACHTGKP